MKKSLLLLLSVIGLVGLQSCEGPEGLPGRDGINGRDGIAESEVFEIRTNFNEANGHSVTFENNINIAKSDIMLVYRLDGIDNGVDIWRMLPQTYYFNEGEIDYNFDFSQNDFRVFLSATVGGTVANFQGGRWTNNQVFRAVVIKGVNMGTQKSYSDTPENIDYDTVIKKYNLENAPIKILKEK